MSANKVKIGDRIISGFQNGVYKPAEDYCDEGTRIVRINDYDNDGTKKFKGLRRLLLSETEINRFFLKPNDILINRVNSLSHIGKSCMVEELEDVTVFESNMMRLRLTGTSGISPAYLFIVLNSPCARDYFRKVAKPAVAQASINQEDIRSLAVHLPSLKEQIAIASLLSTWDLAVEKTERLVSGKEKQFTWLVKSMVADKCDRWEHLRADKIFKTISEKQNDDEELLSVTQDRGVIPRAMLEGRVMSPQSGTDGYKLIKKGDFAISLRSFQGGIEYSQYQGLISPAYTVLRPKLELHEEFYIHFLKSYLFIEKYLSIAVIGIRDGKQISIPDFMSVKIPLPPIDEQKQIALILNAARLEIYLLKKEAEAYRRQKRGLMQKLLTGEWRVRLG